MGGFRCSSSLEAINLLLRNGPYAFRKRMQMKKQQRSIALVFVITLLSVIPYAYAGIATTRHNLSTSGPGPVRAVTEQKICVFCHTPHNSIQITGFSTPLWNHVLSTASNYVLYSSPTLLSRTSPAIQPDGSSKLCLSCHDGTVAIGAVGSNVTSTTSIVMSGTGAGGVMPAGLSNMGTNLSGHHPISIEVNSQLITDKGTQCTNNLVSWRVCTPPLASPIKFKPTLNTYPTGTRTYAGVQCSSCHDPHENTPSTNKFMRVNITGPTGIDPLCVTCHVSCAQSCP